MRAAALVAGVLALPALAPVSAGASTGAPVFRLVALPTGGSADETDDVRATAADLAAQQAELERLRAQVSTQSDVLAAAQAKLALEAATAAAALEAFATAVRTSQEAQQVEARERRRWLDAELSLAEQQDQLGTWARQAYRNGAGSLAESPAIVTILTVDSAQDVSTTYEVLRRVGRVKSRSVEAFTTAREERKTTAQAAAAAAGRAEEAAASAAQSRQAADVAVAAQRAAVEEQAAVLATAKAQEVVAEDAVGTAADALAQAQAAADAASADQWRYESAEHNGELAGPVGDCPGLDVSGYPNGKLPVEALCPLRGAAGHRLRADAAHAFNQMSQRFSAVFGKPLCVTDSYRTYEQQVDLRARKPHLAAVPGTSNHGWGTATDLCGGVERFGTRQHEWLADNAPLYGWFHPSWARAGGSKPEPWHFEFGG